MRELFKRQSIFAVLTAVSIASSNLISPSPLIADGNTYDENGNCCDAAPGCSIGDIALIGGAILIGAGVGAAVASSEKGKHGKKGHDGDPGSSGFPGPTGPRGITGTGVGPQGPQGATGPDGPVGPQGITGPSGDFPVSQSGNDKLEFRFEADLTLDAISPTNPYVIGFVVAPNQQVFTTAPLNISHQVETISFQPFTSNIPYIGLYDAGYVVSDDFTVSQTLGQIEVNFYQADFNTGGFSLTADNDVYTTPNRLWQRNEQFTIQYSYSPFTNVVIPVLAPFTPTP